MTGAGNSIVFNAAQQDLALWPYHVPVGGRTVARQGAEMVRQRYHEHVWILSLEGQGVVELGARRFGVPEGGFAWLDTARANAHGADDCADWRYLWMSVAGETLDALQDRYGFAQKPVVEGMSHLAPLFERVLQALVGGAQDGGALIGAKVAEVLAELANSRAQEISQGAPDAIDLVTARLRRDITRSWSVSDMAALAGMSASQLFRRFQAATGSSPMGWLRQERMVLATYLLRSTDVSIGQVAQRCGYGDPLHFSRDFKRQKGLAPSRYRAQFR